MLVDGNVSDYDGQSVLAVRLLLAEQTHPEDDEVLVVLPFMEELETEPGNDKGVNLRPFRLKALDVLLGANLLVFEGFFLQLFVVY